jgi:hypothetical protein
MILLFKYFVQMPLLQAVVIALITSAVYLIFNLKDYFGANKKKDK